MISQTSKVLASIPKLLVLNHSKAFRTGGEALSIETSFSDTHKQNYFPPLTDDGGG